TLNALGTVTPLSTVVVQPQIAGTLEQLDFKEGETVKKGAPLALIDPRPYEAALAQYQGQLARDTALLGGAKRDLARYNRLLREDSVSRQQRDDQQALVEQYEGTVVTDKAQIDNARLNISYCHVTAPIGGRLGLRQVDAGNYVSLNTVGGLVTVTQTQPTSVIFSLPEDDLPEIMKQLKAGAPLPVAALDRNMKTTLAEGALETVDNAIDTSTGTIKMRADFANGNDALFANQFVNVKLLLKTLKNAVVIPEAAVHSGTPGDYVYVVKADNTVSVTPVKLGPSANGAVAVLSGLKAGDTIVTEGADRLKDGAKVTLPGRAAQQ
ncbi:MAG: efflux RND transporter periplasmic adaptor subunit, partial [Alphaproteobacteria bacterium]|nr:efflux RND transporter periplasmic adaptor subunit [Alphaproteobacteria bacterium]